MARPKPPTDRAGHLAYSINDPRRNKPSMFNLGGYFNGSGRGDRGPRSSSSEQQKSDKGKRGSLNKGGRR